MLKCRATQRAPVSFEPIDQQNITDYWAVRYRPSGVIGAAIPPGYFRYRINQLERRPWPGVSRPPPKSSRRTAPWHIGGINRPVLVR